MSLAIWLSGSAAFAAVSFVAAELTTRYYLKRWGGYFPLLPGLRQRFELSTEALPSLEPVVHWRVNSDGERADEYKPGSVRGLVLGGSCVEGYYLDQESTVAGQLQSQLQSDFDGRAVHFGSIARSRISCAQIRQMLARSLPRFGQLDCVVVMVGASDMVRWLEQGAPTEAWQDEAPMDHIFGLHPEGQFVWSPGKLALRALLVRAKQHFFAREDRRSGVGKRLVTLREKRGESEPKLDSVADPSLMLESYATGLGELLEDLKSAAKQVIVAHQPWFDKDMTAEEDCQMWNFGTGEIYAGGAASYYSHRVIRDLMQRVSAVTGEVAKRHNVRAVNMPQKMEPSLESYYDFLHFTPKGARHVAEVLADAIRAGN